MKHDATFAQIFEYLFLKNLFFFFIAMHFAMLVAVIFSLSTFSRNSEIVAMKAGGMSTLRIYLPFIVLGFVLSGSTFFYNEYVVPYANTRADEIKNYEIRGKERRKNQLGTQRWYRGPDDSLYQFAYYDAKQNTMLRVSYFEFGEPFHIQRRVEAHQAVWDGAGWQLSAAREILFTPGAEVVRNQHLTDGTLDLGLEPKDYEQEIRKTRSMGYAEILQRIEMLESLGYDATELRVDAQGKIAQAFIGFALLILGLPYGIVPPRQGGIGWGAGIAVLLALSYFICFNVCLQLGYLEIVSPFWAAWGANVLFGTFGLFAIFKREK